MFPMVQEISLTIKVKALLLLLVGGEDASKPRNRSRSSRLGSKTPTGA